MAYIPNPTITQGGVAKVNSTDTTTADLLRDVLLELRKMNIHMQLITDEEIKEGDII